MGEVLHRVQSPHPFLGSPFYSAIDADTVPTHTKKRGIESSETITPQIDNKIVSIYIRFFHQYMVDITQVTIVYITVTLLW